MVTLGSLVFHRRLDRRGDLCYRTVKTGLQHITRKQAIRLINYLFGIFNIAPSEL